LALLLPRSWRDSSLRLLLSLLPLALLTRCPLLSLSLLLFLAFLFLSFLLILLVWLPLLPLELLSLLLFLAFLFFAFLLRLPRSLSWLLDELLSLLSLLLLELDLALRFFLLFFAGSSDLFFRFCPLRERAVLSMENSLLLSTFLLFTVYV
jgi:hypothetical protein